MQQYGQAACSYEDAEMLVVAGNEPAVFRGAEVSARALSLEVADLSRCSISRERGT